MVGGALVLLAIRRRGHLAPERLDERLLATLATLPDRPGVYLMKDAKGSVLYVGKAQSLRNRVRSYWQKQSAGGRRGEVHRLSLIHI